MATRRSGPGPLAALLSQFRAALGGVVGESRGATDAETAADLDATTPPLDIIDRTEDFVVLLDLPGFAREDISVTVTTSHVEVEAVSGPDRRSGTYVRQERVASRMCRTVGLPAPVAPALSTSRYRSGVLQVVAPKCEAQ